ncbi:MAG: lipid-A-disaccharide synthase-related protein [Bacillota bacterium]
MVLSNGHGEDLLARTLVLALLEEAQARQLPLETWVFPLVGEGRAWQTTGAGIAPPPWQVVGVQAAMPSGGFILEGSGGLWRDLRAGLLGLIRRQMRSLRELAPEVAWVLAVGDVVPLTAGLLVARRPVIFVATAKSTRIRGFGRPEQVLMRRARLVFARDGDSARALAAAGVPARYAGNLMMDALEEGTLPPQVTEGLVIALMPGSHQDAYGNLTVMARAARAIARRWSEPTRFLVPLASGLDEAQAVQALAAAGWEPAPAAEASPGGVWLAPREGGSARLWLASGRFGPMVRACRLAVGLAGTANEQAAGLGKPVVAFPGPGFQATLTFLRDQQRLLGEAVALTEPDPEAVAREVCQILTDPHRYRRMAEAGQAVMGQPGAAGRMARQILAALTGGEGPFRAVEEAPGGPEGGART